MSLTRRLLCLPAVALLAASCFTAAAGARPDESPAKPPTDAPVTRDAAPARRSFEITYVATATVPEGARRAVLWLPIPMSDEDQAVSALRVSGDGDALEVGLADERGENRFARQLRSGPGALSITVRCVVHRRERRTSRVTLSGPAPLPVAAAQPATVARWLERSRLVPTDGPIAAHAERIADGSDDALVLGRRFYDWVLERMRYDKSEPGWGRGDALWACDSRFGNCTDFHSVFIGLARARRTPARFHMGFPLPPERGEGRVRGYHCWASFWAPGTGWVPVDISEADKHPELARYYFGNLTENRIALTQGRDIRLPGQVSPEPLNFAVYPYLEVDGAASADGLTWSFTYRDVR
jgi:transglutaminase-like putative cysteine protease